MAHAVRGGAGGGLPGIHRSAHPGGSAEDEHEAGGEEAEADGNALQGGWEARSHNPTIQYPPRVFNEPSSAAPHVLSTRTCDGSTSASSTNGKAHGR